MFYKAHLEFTSLDENESKRLLSLANTQHGFISKDSNWKIPINYSIVQDFDQLVVKRKRNLLFDCTPFPDAYLKVTQNEGSTYRAEAIIKFSTIWRTVYILFYCFILSLILTITFLSKEILIYKIPGFLALVSINELILFLIFKVHSNRLKEFINGIVVV